jgi:hypothetical protein
MNVIDAKHNLDKLQADFSNLWDKRVEEWNNRVDPQSHSKSSLQNALERIDPSTTVLPSALSSVMIAYGFCTCEIDRTKCIGTHHPCMCTDMHDPSYLPFRCLASKHRCYCRQIEYESTSNCKSDVHVCICEVDYNECRSIEHFCLCGEYPDKCRSIVHV